MQFAVQDNHRPRCKVCGQHPLVKEAASFATLEVEVKEMLGDRPPWWRPVARASHDRTAQHIDQAAQILREATHRA